jgi:zinc protease
MPSSFFSLVKRFCLALLLVSAQLVAGQAKPAPARKPDPVAPPSQQTSQPKPSSAPVLKSVANQSPKLVEKVLQNGLQVIVYEDHSVPLVTVEFDARAGSMEETISQNGYAHITEHMIFKGNKVIGEQEYGQNIDQLGILYNAETREENVNAYLTGLSTNFSIMLRALRDFVRYPSFDPQQLAQEEQVVLGEIDRAESNPYTVLSREMNQRLFKGNASRKNPIGAPDVVRVATAQQLREFHDRFWVPNNGAVVITGDVDPQDAMRLVQMFFGDWPRVPDPIAGHMWPAFERLEKSEGAVLTSPVSAVIVEMGWQGPSVGVDTPATYAADVFSFILRQPNSRFQRALVDSGLTSGVELGYYTQRYLGPINAILQTDNEHARAAVQAFWTQVSHFTDADYFSDQELENAKGLLAADELYGRERPSEYIHRLGFWWAVSDVDYLRGYQPNLAAVTRADIRKYLETYVLKKPHISLALLSADAQQKVKLKPEELVGP